MVLHAPSRAALAAAVAMAALSASSGSQVVREECQQVFGGEVCASGTLVGGTVTEFGARVAMATVENAPMEGPMVFPPVAEAVIPLPAEIASGTGFSHLAVNWERHGHPPALFMTPHFDFHFFTIGPQAVQAIDCVDTRKPASLPTGYALPDVDVPGLGTLVGLCVPQMGMHGMPSAEVSNTTPFDASMLVGYYGGSLVFLEPMIARTTLTKAQNFQLAVPPAVPGTPSTVRWPSRFEAIYDADTRVYRFVFSMKTD
jgi:hypothetical protein